MKKEIKKAILKLIIFALLIKQKIKMLLMAAQTFLQFKFLLVAIVYVVSNIVKIWLDIKSKHQPQKVIYYENAHHQHHYEPEHGHHEGGYDDHHEGWGGLWGRSIVATESTNTPSSGSNSNYFPRSLNLDNKLKHRARAHDLAYSGQKPIIPVKENQ